MNTGCDLQINLSPGDSAYAEIIVPRLVRAHPWVNSRLAIVDCQKPQLTRANRDARRYAEPGFSYRCREIVRLAQTFQAQGVFDEVFVLEDNANHELKLRLTRKFTNGLIPPRRTHDYHGAALMAYWAAMDLTAQRFVLHYDADILLYQQADFDWALAALRYMDAQPDVIMASPRIAPPGFAPDAPSLNEGRPNTPTSGGWLNDWFSTRCFLLDRQRLAPFLPLVRGQLWWQTLFYRMVQRRYPASPEILLFQSAGARGARRLNLASAQAWILHPTSKPPEFLERLPEILDCVAQGHVPPAQIGHTEVDLTAWEHYLDARR